jgi:hypothetical protein
MIHNSFFRLDYNVLILADPDLINAIGSCSTFGAIDRLTVSRCSFYITDSNKMLERFLLKTKQSSFLCLT